MPVMIQALLPVFVLILLGYLFRRWHFPGGDFWPQAERFTYYVLFPAMLIFKLGQAQVPASAYGDILMRYNGSGVGRGRYFPRYFRAVSVSIPTWPWQQPVCCLGMTACR